MTTAGPAAVHPVTDSFKSHLSKDLEVHSLTGDEVDSIETEPFLESPQPEPKTGKAWWQAEAGNRDMLVLAILGGALLIVVLVVVGNRDSGSLSASAAVAPSAASTHKHQQAPVATAPRGPAGALPRKSIPTAISNPKKKAAPPTVATEGKHKRSHANPRYWFCCSCCCLLGSHCRMV